jgi:hypothetical protein
MKFKLVEEEQPLCTSFRRKEKSLKVFNVELDYSL